MLILPSLVAMIVLGGAIGRCWALSLPILLGAGLAVLFAMSGYLWDGPVVFMVLVAETGTALGVFLRRSLAAARSVAP